MTRRTPTLTRKARELYVEYVEGRLDLEDTLPLSEGLALRVGLDASQVRDALWGAPWNPLEYGGTPAKWPGTRATS